MTDRPIIFSAGMVRAILREIERPGTGKTQTRRVLPERLQRQFSDVVGEGILRRHPHQKGIGWDAAKRLWVREAWRSTTEWNASPPRAIQPGYVLYEADGPFVAHSYGKLRQSIFLPRWASRLTLLVSEVRVQRLQEISEADAVAEGVEPEAEPFEGKVYHRNYDGAALGGHLSARASFSTLWNMLHGPDAWDANPYVAAIAFRPILANIDTLAAGFVPSPALDAGDGLEDRG